MTHGLMSLRNLARGQRGADTWQASPFDGLADATDDLARELAEARESLERELAAQAAAAGTTWPPSAGPAPPAPSLAGKQQPRIVLREGHKMTFGEQTRQVAGLAWRQARRNVREMRQHPGGMINGLLAQKGRSVDDQIAYKREKRWVPAGHDDGIADKAGTLYQDLIGIPGVAFFNACKGIVGSMFAAGSAFLACYLIAAAMLIIVGDRTTGVAMLAGLPITVIVTLIGLEAWVQASRRAKQPPPPASDGDADGDEYDDAGYYPPSE